MAAKAGESPGMLLAFGARAKLAQTVSETVLAIEDFVFGCIFTSELKITRVLLVPALACTNAKFTLPHLDLRLIGASFPE